MFQAASAPPNGLGLVSVVESVDGCGKNGSRTPNYSIFNPERADEIVAKTDLGSFSLIGWPLSTGAVPHAADGWGLVLPLTLSRGKALAER